MNHATMERKAWRAVAVLVGALVALFGGSEAWSALAHQTTVIDVRPYRTHISELVLDAESAAVRVEPGPPDQVTVRQILGWTLRKPVVAMTWEGAVLHVSARCHRLPGLQSLGVDEPGCSTELVIGVPPKTRVSGRSTAGRTQVRDLSGEVHLQSRSGGIELVRLSGPVWAATSSGEIGGSELSSPQVRAASGSGKVDLDFTGVPKAVTLTSTSGDLSLMLPGGDSRYSISGRSTSGAWSIDPALADAGSPNTVDLVTDSGAATISARTGSPPADPGRRPRPPSALGRVGDTGGGQ